MPAEPNSPAVASAPLYPTLPDGGQPAQQFRLQKIDELRGIKAFLRAEVESCSHLHKKIPQSCQRPRQYMRCTGCCLYCDRHRRCTACLYLVSALCQELRLKLSQELLVCSTSPFHGAVRSKPQNMKPSVFWLLQNSMRSTATFPKQ